MRPLSDIRIVLLDDEVTLASILAAELASDGYRTSVYANKDECLVLMPALMPDIIITDQNSPRMNGLDFITAVRRQPKYDNTAIILLTGSRDPEVWSAAKALGVAGIFPKPYDFAELRRFLRCVCEKLDEPKGVEKWLRF